MGETEDESMAEYERLRALFRTRSFEELVATCAVATQSFSHIRKAACLPETAAAAEVIAEVDRLREDSDALDEIDPRCQSERGCGGARASDCAQGQCCGKCTHTKEDRERFR